MGECAEYILSGDDCQVCGEFIGGGMGFPRSCPACRKRERAESRERTKDAPFIMKNSLNAKVALKFWLKARLYNYWLVVPNKDNRGGAVITLYEEGEPLKEIGSIHCFPGTAKFAEVLVEKYSKAS